MEQTNKYQKSIDRLNDALGKEIATTLQYMYFHTIFEDAGYEHLSNLMRGISIAEMRHIEHIAERILFLEGDVNISFATAMKLARALEMDFLPELKERKSKKATTAVNLNLQPQPL